MIAALDVQYDELAGVGHAAAIVFEKWEDTLVAGQYTAECTDIKPYQPGLFFDRELPCLLKVLGEIQESLDAIVIDGYVTLGDKPGLGYHLWTALLQRLPTIGVAKSRYRTAAAREIRRGQSTTPLFITSCGVDSQFAAECIIRMAGSYRIPTLLKAVDGLARRAN